MIFCKSLRNKMRKKWRAWKPCCTREKNRPFSVRIILLKKLTTKRNRWLISLEIKRASRNSLGEKMSFSQTLFLDESVQDSWPLMVVLMIYHRKGSWRIEHWEPFGDAQPFSVATELNKKNSTHQVRIRSWFFWWHCRRSTAASR